MLPPAKGSFPLGLNTKLYFVFNRKRYQRLIAKDLAPDLYADAEARHLHHQIVMGLQRCLVGEIHTEMYMCPYAARSIYVLPRSAKQLLHLNLVLRLDIRRVHLRELELARHVVVDAVPVGVGVQDPNPRLARAVA